MNDAKLSFLTLLFYIKLVIGPCNCRLTKASSENDCRYARKVFFASHIAKLTDNIYRFMVLLAINEDKMYNEGKKHVKCQVQLRLRMLGIIELSSNAENVVLVYKRSSVSFRSVKIISFGFR